MKVVYDDESDLDASEPEESQHEDEVVSPGPSRGSADWWKRKEEEELKAKIETFDAETATALAAFKELQPTVFLRNVREEFPDQIPENPSRPDKNLSVGIKDGFHGFAPVTPQEAVVDQDDSLEDELLADAVVETADSTLDKTIDSVKSFGSDSTLVEDLMDLNSSIVSLEDSDQTSAKFSNEVEESDDEIVEIEVVPNKGALKRKSDTVKSNGEPEVKKKGPTEMERIDQVLAQLEKLKEEQKSLTNVIEELDLMKGDKTKGSKEKQPVKPKVDHEIFAQENPNDIKTKSDQAKVVGDIGAEEMSKGMKSKSDQLKEVEGKNVKETPKQDKCKQCGVSKQGMSFVCCEFVTLESSDEEDNSEITLTPEKKTSVTGKTQRGSSPPAGNKKVTYKPSPLSKKQPAIIPLMAEKKEGYEESVTNIPIQRETSVEKFTEKSQRFRQHLPRSSQDCRLSPAFASFS